MLLFVTLKSFGQTQNAPLPTTQDSLREAIKELRDGMSCVTINLQYCHDRFQQGLAFTIAGLAGASLSLATASNSKDTSIALAIGGGALEFVGAILMIDSHKFIGRAGYFSFAGDKIAYHF